MSKTLIDSLIDLLKTSWWFNLVFAFLFFVIKSQFFKLAIHDSKNNKTTTVLLQLIAGFSILLLTPLFSFKFTKEISIYALFLASLIFYTLTDRLEVAVLRHLQVSVFSILRQSYRVFLIIYGIVIFKEEIVLAKLVGGLLIILGNLSLFNHRTKIKLDKYVALTILGSFFLATAFVIDVGISEKFNLPIYVSITFLIPALAISFLEKVKFREIKEEIKSKRGYYFWVAGVAWGLSAFFSIRSFRLGDFMIISPLSSLTVLLNFIAAYLFLKEKDNPIAKTVAISLIIVGIFIMFLR